MEELSITSKTVETVKALWAFAGVLFLSASVVVGYSWKVENAAAMAIETKQDLATLRAERELTLREYYGNIATIKTTLDGMQKQMTRIEQKQDRQ